VSGSLSASSTDKAVCQGSPASPPAVRRERGRKSNHLGTEVYCPTCRKYTGTNLLEGHAWIYCSECEKEIEAIVRISNRNSAEQST
jgi:hypothetical protein